MDEQLKRFRNGRDSEQTTLQLKVAAGKEHAKVCCLHTVVYHPFNTHNIKYVCAYVIYKSRLHDVFCIYTTREPRPEVCGAYVLSRAE